jgi:hypothetical protein
MLAPRFGGLLKANPQLCVVAPNYLAGLRCPIWHDALKRSGNPESGLHHKTCANFREVAHRARDFCASKHDCSRFEYSPARCFSAILHGNYRSPQPGQQRGEGLVSTFAPSASDWQRSTVIE